MSKKTYVPKLVKILKSLCVYIARYRVVLVNGLTQFGVSDADAKIDAILIACDAIVLDVEIPLGG